MELTHGQPVTHRRAASLALALCLCAGLCHAATAPEASARPQDRTLSVVIRDVRADPAGGHPDFEQYSAPRPTIGLVEEALSAEGTPALASTSGEQLQVDARSSGGRAVRPALAKASRGDKAGKCAARAGAQITSPASFASWFTDLQSEARRAEVPLTLAWDGSTQQYFFDSAQHEPYRSLRGFWPVNGKLLGNEAKSQRNTSFTMQVNARFMFARGTGQHFTISCDDDCWVYVDGRLVIDLGGVHPVAKQAVELDTLSWLEDGREYELALFRAERRSVGANVRIETTLALSNVSGGEREHESTPTNLATASEGGTP